MKRSIIVKVESTKSQVWVATSDDIGLFTEAETQEALEKKGSPLFHVGSLRSSLPAIR